MCYFFVTNLFSQIDRWYDSQGPRVSKNHKTYVEKKSLIPGICRWDIFWISCSAV